jgi:uncharacterized protein (DUF697 family)
VRGLLASPPHETALREVDLARLRDAGSAVGVDVDPQLLVHPAFAEGIVNVVAAHRLSFVLVGQRHASAHLVLGGAGEAVAASITTPVAIVLGDAGKLADVILVEPAVGLDSSTDGGGGLAGELARRIGGKRVERRGWSPLLPSRTPRWDNCGSHPPMPGRYWPPPNFPRVRPS